MHLDDQYIARASLSLLFEDSQEIEMVGQAETQRALYTALISTTTDVLILDLNLHNVDSLNENGLTICKEVSEKYPSVKTVIFTASDKIEHVDAAFKNGAQGYVLKLSKFEELVLAITTVFGGERYLCEQIKARLK